MKIKKLMFIGLFASLYLSQTLLADAKFEGTIKEIYLHDRASYAYIGVVVDGTWTNNSCGTTDRFIAYPDYISDKMFSMLLTAKTASQTVELGSAGASPECYNNTTQYPILNFVRIK